MSSDEAWLDTDQDSGQLDGAEVACPWCGELGWVALDLADEGDWVQDCEVCCRPWLVRRDRQGLHVDRAW